MLRIVLGQKTEAREADAVCLYAGHDADAAQRAIDGADASFAVVLIADVPHLLKARKSRGAVPAVTAPALPVSEEEGLAMLDELQRLADLYAGAKAELLEERERNAALEKIIAESGESPAAQALADSEPAAPAEPPCAQ